MRTTQKLIVLIAILAGFCAHGKDNLLNNPGFEETSGEQKRIWIKGWDRGTAFNAAAVSLDTKEKYSGNTSLKFSGKQRSGKLTHFLATPDSDYLLEFKTKSVDMQKNALKIMLFAHPGRVSLPLGGGFEDGGTHNWRKHEFRIDKSKLPKKLKSIYLVMRYQGGGGQIYLDDFKLVNLKSGKNIIANPSFEESSKVYEIVQRNPEWHTEEWAYLNIPPQNSRIDDSHTHAGEKSLMLEGGKNVVLVSSGVKPVEKNKKYKLSGWVRSSGLNKGIIEFQLRKKHGKGWKVVKSRVNPVVLCGTKNWHEIESFLAVPENADYDGISVRIYLPNNNAGKIWFDDFSLTEVEKITASKFGNYLINAAFNHYGKSGIPFWWSPLKYPHTRFKDWKTEYFAVDKSQKCPVPGTNALKVKYPHKIDTPPIVISNCLPTVIPSGVYTFSVYLKADRNDFDVEYYDHSLNKRKTFKAGKKWKRFTYTSNRNKREKFLNQLNCYLKLKQPGTLWICAPQFEAGKKATPFKTSKLDDILTTKNLSSNKPKSGTPESICPELAGKPVMDGKLDDNFWKGAKQLTAFKSTDAGGEVKVAPTKVWLGRNSENLYLGVVCESPGLDKLKLKPTDSPWKGDAVELFVSPDKDARKYYHFVCSPTGTTFSEAGCNGSGSFKMPWTAKACAEPDKWSCEFEIPFSSLPFYNISDTWRMNVCRARRLPESKKYEVSSWSRVFDNFHSPFHFGKITEMKSGAISQYGWRTDSLQLSKGKLSLWISGVACPVNSIRTILRCNGKSYKGKPAVRSGETAGSGEFIFTELPADIGRGKPELLIADNHNKILKTIPLQFGKTRQGFDIAKPAVFAEYSLYTSEKSAKIILKNPTDKKMTAEIVISPENSAEIFRKNLTVPAKDKESFIFGIKDLRCGKYRIAMYDKSNNSLAATGELHKLPPAKIVSRYNRVKRFIDLNGKPFCPSIYYGIPSEDWAFERLKAKGYNTIMVTQIPGLRRTTPRGKGWKEKTKKYLDLLHKKDFKVFLGIAGLSYYKHTFGNKKVPFATYKETILDPIRTFKDHPAIIGWWVQDEQGNNNWHNHNGFLESNLLDLYKAIKEVDPYHLAWNNLHGSQVSRSSEPYGSLDCSDIISVDYYPYRIPHFPLSNQPLERFAKIAADLEYNACIVHKPSMYFYQTYCIFGAGRAPSSEECVAQHYIVMVYGTDPNQYLRRPVSNELWDTVAKLNMETMKLFHELFANPEAENIKKGTRSGEIHYCVWKKNDEYYIIAINSSYAKAEFSLNLKALRKKGSGSGNLVPANKQSPALNNSILTYEFKPLEAKIFVLKISR